MLWCICRPGTPVVHNEQGDWVGTFRDNQTAESAVAEHNLFHNMNQKSNSEVIDKASIQQVTLLSNTIQTTVSSNLPRWTKSAAW